MAENEVVITLKEVYEAQQQQGIVQMQMNSKLDRLIDKHDRIDERVDDHEARVRTLEKRVWAIPSLSAVIALASLTYQILSK